MEHVAALLGKADESRNYQKKAEAERQAFNAQFFDAEHHRYDKGSQTAQAMPLVIGLVPESERGAVLAALVSDIRAHENHTTAGDIGFHYVVDALLNGGRSDVLLDMIERTDPPSYGYQLAQGATALTEAWDADPNSSQDHFMLGHAEEWFYRGLAGIDVDFSREKALRLVLRPAVVGNLQWIRARYRSSLGMVQSAWKRTGNQVDYSFAVPVKSTIEVRSSSPQTISVNGSPAAKAPGVVTAHLEGDRLHLVVQSGQYEIRASAPAH